MPKLMTKSTGTTKIVPCMKATPNSKLIRKRDKEVIKIAKRTKFMQSEEWNENERFEYVREVMQKVIKSKSLIDTFYIFDVQNVHQKVKEWKQHLPNVEPFYGVTCNMDQEILKAVIDNKVPCNVSSTAEMEYAIDLGANPSDMIFTNPIKQVVHLQKAAQLGVKMITLDSIDELMNIHKYCPQAQCIIKITTDDSLPGKFGASMDTVKAILKQAKDLNVTVKGISFYIPQKGVTLEQYKKAIQKTLEILKIAKKTGHNQVDMIDLGEDIPNMLHGGSTYLPNFQNHFAETAALINDLISTNFSGMNLRIIGDAGSLIAQNCVHIASRVIGQRKMKTGDRHYYVNGGVYQGFILAAMTKKVYTLEPLFKDVENREKFNTTWWGQTCDSVDWIRKDVLEPEYKTKEWIVSRNHGLYITDITCNFNSFQHPETFYLF